MSEEKEMTFLDHLEELRWHVIRALIAVVVLTIAAFANIEWIFQNVVFAPAQLSFPTFQYMCDLGKLVGMAESLCVKELPFIVQSRNMTGQFMMSVTGAFVIGLIVAFPYVIWEFWAFVKPGLETKERKFSRGAVAVISFLFLLGILFGYYLLCPVTIWFLSTYSISPLIRNEFDITSYVSTTSSLVLGCGILFQFPVIIYFLTKVGLVTPQLMRKYRRHSIVIIIVLGAIITPSADPFSLTVISLPLYLLFEISIFTSTLVVRRMRKAEEAELKAQQKKS